jgi:hypothetical protein
VMMSIMNAVASFMCLRITDLSSQV